MTENRKKTDEELILLSHGGDKRAMEELMLRHAGLVRQCVRGFFLVGGETEDLLQEGMIGLYNAVVDYKPDMENSCSFKNFAYKCVSRRIIDAVKTSSRKKNLALNLSVPVEEEEWTGSTLSPEDMLILSDERREFKQKMSRILSDFEFKVTVMYMDGLTCNEICDACGKPFKSVDNAIQRSKRKLQEILKES